MTSISLRLRWPQAQTHKVKRSIESIGKRRLPKPRSDVRRPAGLDPQHRGERGPVIRILDRRQSPEVPTPRQRDPPSPALRPSKNPRRNAHPLNHARETDKRPHVRVREPRTPTPPSPPPRPPAAPEPTRRRGSAPRRTPPARSRGRTGPRTRRPRSVGPGEAGQGAGVEGALQEREGRGEVEDGAVVDEGGGDGRGGRRGGGAVAAAKAARRRGVRSRMVVRRAEG